MVSGFVVRPLAPGVLLEELLADMARELRRQEGLPPGPVLVEFCDGCGCRWALLVARGA